MLALRRSLLLGPILLLALCMAACNLPGSQTTNSNSMSQGNNYTSAKSTATAGITMATAQPTMNATKTTSGNMGYGNNGNNMNGNNGNMGDQQNTFIHTTTVKINNRTVHVLTTNKGYILYHFRKDTPLQASCTGMCAQAWPPLLAPQGMMTISTSMTLPRSISVHKTANGEQIFYDGHALYTYSGDMAPGQFSGRGIENAWYLVGFTL